MKPNYYHIIDRCIDEGVQASLNESSLTDDEVERLAERISTEIWLQLDMYFTFDDN